MRHGGTDARTASPVTPRHRVPRGAAAARPRIAGPTAPPRPAPPAQAKELGGKSVTVLADRGRVSVGRLYGLDVRLSALGSDVDLQAL